MAAMRDKEQSKPIHVIGDPTVDWMIVRKGLSSSDEFFLKLINKSKSNIGAQPGGSALLTNLLQMMYPGQVVGVTLPAELLATPNTGKVVCTYTIWEQAKDEQGSFRVAEWLDSDRGEFDYSSCAYPGIPQTLVIEDSNQGFRNAPDAWPAVLKPRTDTTQLQHVIFKSSMFHSQEAKESLYTRLIKCGLAGKTTLLVPLSDLRKCPIYIGPSLSWERMLEQVTEAVKCPTCPFTIDGKLSFARVIVSIGLSGALMIEPDRLTLVFDRIGQEGYWEKLYAGTAMGYNMCITAALVRAVQQNPKSPRWEDALERGLYASRELHRLGYRIGERFLAFPQAEIAKVLKGRMNGKHAFAAVSTPISVAMSCKTLLDYELSKQPAQADPAYRLAADIAKQGARIALPRVPVEKVGNWRSADRYEIEGICSIRNLMQDYLRGARAKPLSIAVFGPPGAGKSFAIKQVAKSFGGGRFAEFNCNLSQYTNASELVGAFHQIRDINLRGQIPLVFWDEFDTQLNRQFLGWLRYFLAPMQDGTFLDQGIEHPLGPGIFVFAGGTAHSYEQFISLADQEPARQAKLPDFISRLKGYVDVKGVNPNPHSITDNLYVIRRAFALRVILRSLAPSVFKGEQCRISDAVLRALLTVSRYKHGVRSLESIIAISDLKGKSSFELSSLPHDRQLEVYVNAGEFRALTQSCRCGTLKLGVTGHRFLAEVDKLQAGIRQALEQITAKFPNHDLLVLSPLAQGADRLITTEVLSWQRSRGAAEKLTVVLPFDASEYEKDFTGSNDAETANLRQEFHYYRAKAAEEVMMPPCPTSEAAYLATGRFIADNCDVMIALWDGESAQGSGGTGEIVQRTIKRGIPVYAVRCGNRNPGTSEPTVHPEQGKVFTHNM